MRTRFRFYLLAIAMLFTPTIYGFAQQSAMQSQNPVPSVNQPLVPDAASPGGAAFTLTVNGTGFVRSSTVKWNGSARHTSFVNRSQLTASILASDIAKAQTASVTVSNPTPGGGVSNSTFFQVARPITSVLLDIAADYVIGSGPDSVVTADFNHDGRLDLAVANEYSDTVSILLGNGDGTFDQQTEYATPSYADSLAAGDFNGDGKMDLAVGTGTQVSIFLGNGDGSFQPHLDSNTGGAPTSLAVGDFNRDGRLDVAAIDQGGNAISILIGNGDGTFRPYVNYAVGSAPWSIAAGDFNGDNKLDLAVVNYNDATVSVLLGKGDGSFRPQVTYSTGTQPISLAVGDLNGDAKLDLAVASFYAGNVEVLLGNGDGTFQTHVDYPTGDVPFSVVIGDLNGDDNVDLAVANDGSQTVSVLLGNGDGTFQQQVTHGAGANPQSLAVGDFDGDGRLDLAVANYSFSFTGNGTVSVLLPPTGPNATLFPTSLAFDCYTIRFNQCYCTPAQTSTLTNYGSATLSVRDITIAGSTVFSQTNTCGTKLGAGKSCNVTISWDDANSSGTLEVSDDAPGSPQTVSLSGTASCIP